jgi:hypothetical protein
MRGPRGAVAAVVVTGLALGLGAGVTTAGATLPAKDVSVGRLLNVDYRDGVVTPKDVQSILLTTAVTPKVFAVGPTYQGRVCNRPITESASVVAGRSVQYDPSGRISLLDYILAFPKATNAKSFMTEAGRAMDDCVQPYSSGSTTFVPGTPPKMPKVGTAREAVGGTYRFAGGSTANSVTLLVQQGQMVQYSQLIKVDPVTNADVATLAKAMEKRADATRKAAKKAKPRPKTKTKAKTCAALLPKAAIEKAFAIGLQDSPECEYALAQGAGGIDVSFTKMPRAESSWGSIAKGKPVTVKGTADALYSTSENQFGQVTEIIYVRLKNGDMFTILVRGDGAPKDVEAQLTAAAKAAVGNT